jgi:hypothetical protein
MPVLASLFGKITAKIAKKKSCLKAFSKPWFFVLNLSALSALRG